MVAWRFACSAGNATLTTVPSMNVMLDARIVATRVQRLDLGALTTPFDWAASVAGPSRLDLSRPQPSEDGRREQRVDQPIKGRLGSRAPGACVPNRHLPERNRVPDECGDYGEPEDGLVWRAGGQRAPGNVGGKPTHDQDV